METTEGAFSEVAMLSEVGVLFFNCNTVGASLSQFNFVSLSRSGVNQMRARGGVTKLRFRQGLRLQGGQLNDAGVLVTCGARNELGLRGRGESTLLTVCTLPSLLPLPSLISCHPYQAEELVWACGAGDGSEAWANLKKSPPKRSWTTN